MIKVNAPLDDFEFSEYVGLARVPNGAEVLKYPEPS